MSAGTDREFKQFVDRVLRCREAEDDAKSDTKAVYAEFATWGGDKAALGGLVNELRRKEKNGPKFEEATATLGVYREAYERASHVHAREGRQVPGNSGQLVTTPNASNAKASSVETPDFVTTPHDAETGEILTQEQPVEPATAESTPETTKGESDAKSADDASKNQHLNHGRRLEKTNEQDIPEHQPIRIGRQIAGVSAPSIGVSTEVPAESAAEISAPIPHSPAPQASQSLQADKTSEAVAPPAVSLVAQFDNPRCLNACHLAHSKDACHDCLIAWSQRPKDEQKRLWAEANEAAQVAA